MPGWPWIRLPILRRVSDRISVAEVAKVARLARLALTEEELARATVQLGDIVDHFADIDELDLDDVEPMTQPFPLTNVLRDDVVTDSLDPRRGPRRRPRGGGRPLQGPADHRVGGVMAMRAGRTQ